MKTIRPCLPRTTCGLAAFGAFAVSLVISLAAGAAPAMASPAEQTVTLRGVSVFAESTRSDYVTRGQRAQTEESPSREVKTYPAFKSKKPIYGSIEFGGDFQNRKAGVKWRFALDESGGTGKGYDRLYFDANGDLNLENDGVRTAQPNPPQKAKVNYSGVKQQAVFEPVLVRFDFGGQGEQRVELAPRLVISSYEGTEYKSVEFVRTRAFEGTVKLSGQEYEVLLGNDYMITGRLDDPNSYLALTPKGSSGRQISWWGGDRLRAVHKAGGQFYTFSATALGDRLTVRPYKGELGTIEVRAGGRKLKELAMSGSLEATNRAVAIGDDFSDGWGKSVQSCQLPVGDYLPAYITFEYGQLRISVSQNYHAEGKPRDSSGRPPVYAVQIRKDRPFVFDFSSKPEVMFASPDTSRAVKPGTELMVSAVLVDPKLDIMIRGLDDSRRKQTKGPDGKALGYERSFSLDPHVVITRANGEKVAEGVMPFG